MSIHVVRYGAVPLSAITPVVLWTSGEIDSSQVTISRPIRQTTPRIGAIADRSLPVAKETFILLVLLTTVWLASAWVRLYNTMTQTLHLSNRRRVRSFALTAIVLVVAVGMSSSGVVAQSSAAPSVTLSDADVTVEASPSTNDVRGTYRLQVASVGSGDQRLTALTGTVWSFPGRGISDFTAVVDGQRVDATTERNGEVVDVSIPVRDVENGDTVTLRVSYSATNANGALKVPLFVPDYATPGSASVVDVTTTLPQGTQAQGDVFPTVQSSNGNVLTFSLLHVPDSSTRLTGTGAVRC